MFQMDTGTGNGFKLLIFLFVDFLVFPCSFIYCKNFAHFCVRVVNGNKCPAAMETSSTKLGILLLYTFETCYSISTYGSKSNLRLQNFLSGKNYNLFSLSSEKQGVPPNKLLHVFFYLSKYTIFQHFLCKQIF